MARRESRPVQIVQKKGGPEPKSGMQIRILPKLSAGGMGPKREGFSASHQHRRESEMREGKSREPKRMLYGQLIVLGYNGVMGDDDASKRRSRFNLYQRAKSNGVKPARVIKVKSPDDCPEVSSDSTSTMAFTISEKETMVVEYVHDKDSDIFQIGRSSDGPIDCVVLDTVSEAERKLNGGIPPKSTVSRFACRIVVDRRPPYTARFYAAGFDTNKHIKLGERARKWMNKGEIDGLTTNGVLMLHPKGAFTSTARPGRWREVSVGGNLYALRDSQTKGRMQEPMNADSEDEDNVLTDGTLIDLCGVTLLWRSALGTLSSPSREMLAGHVETLNASKPQCPVSLNTLVLQAKRGLPSDNSGQNAWVYLGCGHVHGKHGWKEANDDSGHPDGNRTCPLCRKVGPFVPLRTGFETAFWIDQEAPTHCFTPCGHMTSENTARYWASTSIPKDLIEFHTVCPFCLSELSPSPGYVRLIFQDRIGW